MASGRREIPFRLTAENRTQAAFRSLRRDVQQINSLGRTFAGVFGVAFGVAAFAQFAQGARVAIRDLDELAKKADELNIAISELDQIRFAGGQLGVAEQQVDRLLSRLTQFQSQAIQGVSGTEVDLNRGALGALGIGLEEVRRQNPQQLLSSIIRGLSGIADEQERVAIAQQIAGGRGSRALLRLAEQGSAGFARLRAEQELLTGDLEQAARASEALSDGFDLLQRATFANLLDAVQGVLGGVENIRRRFLETALFIRNFDIANLDFVGDALFTGLPNALANAVSEAQDYANAQLSILEQQEAINRSTDAFNDALSRVRGDGRGGFLNLRDTDRLTRQIEGNIRRGVAAIADEARDETRQLEQSARFLLGQRRQQQDTGRAVTGSAGQLAQAVINANQQAADPGVQVLEAILRRLEQEKAAAAIDSLKETIGRLNNPVFS